MRHLRGVTLPTPLIALLLCLALHACAKTSHFTDATPDSAWDASTPPDLPPPSDAFFNPCDGSVPTLTGKVFAPNGKDPVAGALVAIPVTLTPLPDTVQCSTCNIPGDYHARTYTDATGAFTLEGLPQRSPLQLEIRKGMFRRVVEVDFPGCAGPVSLPADKTTLPGKNKHYGDLDRIPRIAVITGAWDRLEKVLDKLGVEEKVFFNGTDLLGGSESMQALLQNGALLAQHHIVFINCGTRFEALVTQPGPARNVLREYVKAGGRLFATDYSYDFIEQVFPEFIDFQASTQNEWTLPEEPNAAEVGTANLDFEADVMDESLAQWLKLPEIGALLPNGKLHVRGFKDFWAMQSSVSERGKVWVSGRVSGIGVSGETRPLTSSYSFIDDDGQGCGRVFFSSYHTHGEQTVLLPQERVLEYLMLEIGTCPLVK
ncbi:MAG: carboxypeptidase regulatory-like domain-containing protein [Deltaproteobacteria bacterium]|nr:carboxypeptidase regulatory-like domain-containing protein [Deltaproteobacteria bacterium]